MSDRLSLDADKPAISVSGGVATFPRDGSSPTQLLRAADKLFYEAKVRGSKRQKPAARLDDPAKTGTLF